MPAKVSTTVLAPSLESACLMEEPIIWWSTTSYLLPSFSKSSFSKSSFSKSSLKVANFRLEPAMGIRGYEEVQLNVDIFLD
jgi:hypothetical protein